MKTFKQVAPQLNMYIFRKVQPSYLYKCPLQKKNVHRLQFSNFTFFRHYLVDMPHCHQCSHDCFKKLDIWRLPPVIVLHLKRLSFTAAGAVRKAHAHVAFPLRDLDLSQLVIGPAAPRATAVYDHCAVVEHHRSSQSGHYTACCYNQQAARWYRMDDVRVKEVPEVKVREAQAYMLCYAAKDSA